MITLPHVAQQKPVDKPDAPDIQVSDGEGIAEDFLQLVRTAKAGLTRTPDETILRKVAVKNDSLKNDSLKLAAGVLAELSVGKKIASEPQETLAALLAPQGKTTTAAKALLTASDKADPDTDTDTDLQAMNALFAMLPHQQTAINLTPAVADKPATASKGLSLNLAASPHPVAARTADTDTDNARPLSHDSSAGRFALTDDKVTLRVADNATPLTPSFSSSSAPVQSSVTPLAVPTAPILNSQLGTQEWQQQLSQQVMLFTRQGQQHAELRLHPEHLGKVEISLKLDDNQLQLQIMSPHSHVRAAIEAALPMLRSSLSENGLQLSQSQVGGEGSMQQQHTEQREQQAARQNGTFSVESQDDDEITLVAGEALQRLAQNDGAVDTFA